MSSNTPTYRLRTRPIKREDAGGLPPAPPADEAAAEQQDLDHDQSATPSPDETPVYEPAPYLVGYKKPPLHTRFPKGVCPNPKGRPKGVKNVRTRVFELANEKVKVRQNGKTKNLSKLDIGITKAMNRFAETGDFKFLNYISGLDISLSDARDGSGSSSASLVEQDKPNKQLLQWFLDQNLPKNGSDGEGA